jgi:hypothetical protein
MTALAAVALLGGAVGLNCSKSSNPSSPSGDVQLAVVLPSGATISTVSYAILNSGGGTITSGSFTVTDPHATVSLDMVVPVTPAGDAGDKVTLTASATNPNESCTGTSPSFTVAANSTQNISMTLTCGTGTQPGATGNVGVTATLVEGDNCPSITSAVVGPDETSVGGSAMVAATAHDADTTETLTFAWSPAANFANPNVANTTYNCTASGTQTFTLKVTDSHVPTACSTTATLTIKCDNVATCGNGIVEPGETCDPPNGTTCDSTCHTIVTSTGGTTGSGGAAGAAGGTTGTGGATGGTTGTGGAAGAAGGTTGTGGAAGAAGGGGIVEDNAACVMCEASGLADGTCAGTTPTGGSGNGCDGFTNATDKANCLALITCLRGTACQNAIHNASADYGESGTYPQPFDDPHPCLCGNIPLATCVSMTSGWTGVCAAQFTAAAAADSLTLANAYTSKASAVGIGVNLSICDIDKQCQTQCVIPQ